MTPFEASAHFSPFSMGINSMIEGLNILAKGAQALEDISKTYTGTPFGMIANAQAQFYGATHDIAQETMMRSLSSMTIAPSSSSINNIP